MRVSTGKAHPASSAPAVALLPWDEMAVIYHEGAQTFVGTQNPEAALTFYGLLEMPLADTKCPRYMRNLQESKLTYTSQGAALNQSAICFSLLNTCSK